MRKVARGEMTTRSEVVLIVWGVDVRVSTRTTYKLLFSSPKKERNFPYHQQIKAYVCREARRTLA